VYRKASPAVVQDYALRKLPVLSRRKGESKMNNYIPADKLLAEIQRRKQQDITIRERGVLVDIETAIASLQREKSSDWSAEDEEMLDAMIDIVANSLYEPLCPREGMLAWLNAIRSRTLTNNEQTEAGLEEEIERIIKNEDSFMKFQVKEQLIKYVARHFAEWGATHLYKKEKSNGGE